MSFLSVIRRAATARAARLGLLMAAASLVACGGGDLVSPFNPNRVISFGDEMSVLTSTGGKYAINFVDTTVSGATPDCTRAPIWIQSVAASFNLSYPQCPVTNFPARNLLYAAPGAKVADVTAQIARHVATVGRFTDNELVTILVGQNDILEQYALFPTKSRAAVNAELAARGKAVGDQVNAIVNAGGRVLIVTAPDLRYTPFAIAEKAAKPDVDREILLEEFSFSFNKALRLSLIEDGRLIAFVNLDGLVRLMADDENGGYSFANRTQPACLSTAPLPNCTSATLVPGADQTEWLWADNLRLGSQGQYWLGERARQRATQNPL